jgi:DNA repair exonuclease SbcCD ATPase subunit
VAPRILRVNLENYRSFRGEHSFDLATTPEDHVVLIFGPNSSGKSTLTEALELCLYGSDDFENMGPLVSQSVIDEAETGDRVSGSAAVTVETESGDRYRFSREVHVLNSRRGPRDEIGDVVVEKRVSGEVWEVVDNPSEVQTTQFPPSSSIFVFPDADQGIGLNTWGESTTYQAIVQAVQETYAGTEGEKPNYETVNAELQKSFLEYLDVADRFIYDDFEFDFSSEYIEISDDIGSNAVSNLSAGESILISFALLLAAGDAAASTLPLVLDIPFGRLNPEGREVVREMFRKAAPRQLILATIPQPAEELRETELGEKIAVTHELEYVPAQRH